jgi:hypothetical protein
MDHLPLDRRLYGQVQIFTWKNEKIEQNSCHNSTYPM